MTNNSTDYSYGNIALRRITLSYIPRFYRIIPGNGMQVLYVLCQFCLSVNLSVCHTLVLCESREIEWMGLVFWMQTTRSNIWYVWYTVVLRGTTDFSPR